MSEQLTIGELFAGYGGLGMAVEAAFDARLSWYAEFEEAPSKILAHHYPDLTNYGDVTAVDWATVPPVDIISGGSPCQDVSLAGRRAGMTEGTRSNLWGAMRTAIETIRPKYVVWENVRGALSARAASASDLESGAGLLGEGPGNNLRALGRVLGDLADLGYDAQWCGLRASDVGAPTSGSACSSSPPGEMFRTPCAAEAAGGPRNPDRPGATMRLSDQVREEAERGVLLPTPVAQPSGNTPEDHLRKKPGRDMVTDLAIIAENGLLESGGRLLPTPRASDPATTSNVAGQGFRRPLGQVAREDLLPTPRASDGTKGGPNQRGSSGDLMLPSVVHRLTGAPTPPPSTGGSNYADQRLPLPN